MAKFFTYIFTIYQKINLAINIFVYTCITFYLIVIHFLFLFSKTEVCILHESLNLSILSSILNGKTNFHLVIITTNYKNLSDCIFFFLCGLNWKIRMFNHLIWVLVNYLDTGDTVIDHTHGDPIEKTESDRDTDHYEIPAHCVILATRCRWFQRALLSGMRESIDKWVLLDIRHWFLLKTVSYIQVNSWVL